MLTSTFISPTPQRLLIIRLLCWLAIPAGVGLGVWAVSAAFNWLPRAATSVNYTLAFCLLPELIVVCPALIQGIIINRLLPGSRLSMGLWLSITFLAATIGWAGLWICAPIFAGATDPVQTETGLFGQTVSTIILGLWIGAVTGIVQGLMLDDRALDIVPGWVWLSLSGWVATAAFYLILWPVLF